MLILIFLVTFLIFNIHSVQSQTNSDKINNYNWFDGKIGVENTGIYNGIIFKEKFRTVNGNHKFYLTSQFINGNIIYNGQPYYNVKMKYDIYEDIVIVQLPDDSEYSIIQLINDKINEFSINNHKFLKISRKYEKFFNEPISGFYEIFYQSKHLNLLKKNRKNRKKQIVGNLLYSQFKDKSEYIIVFNDEYYKINSKKYLVKLYPKLKKNINHFYNFNKQLHKLDQDTFMINLIEHISSLIKLKGTSN